MTGNLPAGVLRRYPPNRGAALADLGLVALAGMVVYAGSLAGWWATGRQLWQPLGLAGAAAVVHAVLLALGLISHRRTAFDLLLLVFLATAGVGVWAAYHRPDALVKFSLLALSLLLYSALASQPPRNLPWAAGLFALLGPLFAAHFLLTHDWSASPADLQWLNRLGVWWTAVRPAVSLGELPQNTAGGLLALSIPLQLALCSSLWQPRRQGRAIRLALLIGVLSAAFSLTGLAMTSSRGAWLALGAALGLWAALHLGSRAAAHFSWPDSAVPVFLAALLLLGLALGALAFPGGLVGLANRLPGLPTGSSRWDLDQEAFRLFADFPFTGGGLASFAGLYSQYIRVIPYFVFSYGHNLYLDMAVEQGVFGWAAGTAILLGSLALAGRLWPACSRTPCRLWSGAVFAGLAAVALHGLVDDALYGTLGSPFLFTLPGFAVAVAGAFRLEQQVDKVSPLPAGSRRLLLSAVLVITLGGAAASWRTLAAAGYANLGAVEMARVELRNYPANQWDNGSRVGDLEGAKSLLQRAVALDPQQAAAHYRLGMIALLRRDYPLAVEHLEQAHQNDASHPGIRKALAFAYVWTGQIDPAELLMDRIPEARSELDAYTRWWPEQGRDDLAAAALRMLKRLE